MNREVRCAAAAGLLIGIGLANPALAQKQGGTLRVFHRDSPASMSILEEGSISAIMPLMGVFHNIDRVTTEGDNEATFRLKRPQPAVLSLLASGYSPVYPCHVSAREMRSHPIGTGPFKFVEYKPSQSIKVARNPDYWKPGRPYLDGIEYTIIPN